MLIQWGRHLVSAVFTANVQLHSHTLKQDRLLKRCQYIYCQKVSITTKEAIPLFSLITELELLITHVDGLINLLLTTTLQINQKIKTFDVRSLYCITPDRISPPYETLKVFHRLFFILNANFCLRPALKSLDPY